MNPPNRRKVSVSNRVDFNLIENPTSIVSFKLNLRMNESVFLLTVYFCIFYSYSLLPRL
jgi:hypothetical protein